MRSIIIEALCATLRYIVSSGAYVDIGESGGDWVIVRVSMIYDSTISKVSKNDSGRDGTISITFA